MKPNWFVSLALTACCLLLMAQQASAVEVEITDKGVVATVKGMGSFGMGFPTLQPGKLSPVDRKLSGKSADLTYAGDVRLRVELVDDTAVRFRFSNAGAVKSFGFGTQMGLQFGEGGIWATGKGEPQPFPLDKPAKPHLFQGNVGGFTMTDPSGHVLSITGFPEFAYQEILDLREWNNRKFSWKVSIPVQSASADYTITFSEKPHSSAAASNATPAVKVLVDRFGQTTLKDFPGKVNSEADLKADAENESAYWASYKPLAVDKWGGLPGSRERYGLNATGFFRVEQKDGRWLLVNPDGNVTFHLGVCVFTYNPGDDATYIKDRHDIYEWIPPVGGEFDAAFHPDKYQHNDVFSFYAANVIRKYGPISKDQQIARLIDRVRAAGFNAVGAFSGYSPAFAEKHFPRMASVSFNPALPGIRGVADPFDDEARSKTEQAWAASLPKNASDPLIIGYFFANEQGFEDIPRAVPQLPGKYAAKRKLVEMLQAKYPTIEQFNAAWELDMPDFQKLIDTGVPVTTKAAYADMQSYTELFLEEYYRFISETFRKYDKNHLMVASRWQPGTANSEALCRAAGKYMDVISINNYGWGVDPTIPDRVHQWTGGKPQMWSEFFFSSGPESNAAPYNRDMATQKLRGQAYRQYVEHAAASGYVVGIEWFSLIDQAVTGRWFSKLAGERCNNGLFNACDRPYDDCLREMATSHQVIYDVLLDGRKPFVLDDPRVLAGKGAARKETQAGFVSPGTMKIDGLAEGWPGRPPELFRSVKAAGEKDVSPLEAAFKLAWDNQNLYLLANVTDPTPLNNDKEGFNLWQGDAVELFIGSENLDQPGALLFTDRQLLIGSTEKRKPGSSHMVNAARQPEIQVVCVPSVDGTGYTMEAAIPWSCFDFKPSENALLLFDLGVDDAPPGGSRTRQIMWNGGSSKDRTNWGRLRLVP